MAKYSNQDDYLDPNTGILKNKLGIENEVQLEEIEADYAMIRSYELAQQQVKGNFDLNHLKDLHRHLFGDVYDWAGELRNIDISKHSKLTGKTFNLIFLIFKLCPKIPVFDRWRSAAMSRWTTV